ncbi:DNA polymerase, partial [Streptomyces rochei]|uniref:DNA polymerase n=1 Tax=Streptomyces rochei TaxID=1928 RepID=UPI00367D50FC
PVVSRSPKTGAPSFDKNAMKDYEQILANNPQYATGDWGSVAQQILEYRGWQITLSLCYKKFVEKVSPDGRLRCNYKIHGTKTGRTSATDPNLQQVPKFNENAPKIWNRNIKRAFEADEGYTLVQVDVNQGEMRLATGYARQPYLMETFQWNKDMWGQMVAELNRPKAQCKTLTYAKMYGAQRDKLRLILGGDDPDQFITDWEEAHDRIVKFSEKVYQRAKSRGYIHLWTGRIRHLPGGDNGPRLGFNSLLQGGLAEIVKSGMIRLNREVDDEKECRMLLMVHDSVIFEVKTEYLDQYIPLIKSVFSRVEDEKNWDVPFDVTEEFWGKDAA